ncbi:MAG: hypothetical protein IT331_05500 [Anaerolineae bacterium]|nr:hypothetical protein [Anaerolineae bacterium]
MKILFDNNATENNPVKELVQEFLDSVSTLEKQHDMPIIIFQDGVKGSYYIKCSLLATDAASLSDLDAKLDVSSKEGYRANRELLLGNETYLKMEADALQGREFNDIIVEYNTSYKASSSLKVWGGQHRISSISRGGKKPNRYHGFRIYFDLSKEQRTEVALISNTNIAVSNDMFDRMVEETIFGNALRTWCQQIGLLDPGEDFPDTGARSEKITVKKARSFIVNFYLAQKIGQKLKESELDKTVHEPYLTSTGVSIDPKYEEIMKKQQILADTDLVKAGERFAALNSAQYRAVTDPNGSVENRKAYRNKALVESVLCGWSYVAGLLQAHPARLENHYRIPKTSAKVFDPLNAEEMSKFKYDMDPPTYRGLGTRSALKDRQRIAQVFLAKSRENNVVIDKSFMNKAVSTVVGLLSLSKGYTK